MISPDFCVLPFIHLDIQPNGEVSACCHSTQRTILGNLHENDLLEIWNSPNSLKMRELFRKGHGRKYPHCQSCYVMEDIGVTSKRQRENDNWAAVEQELQDQKLHPKLPISLAIRFSNLCNLACRSCKPSASTGWFQDAKFLNPKGTYVRAFSAPKENPLTEQIRPFAMELKHVYFSGGEPLLEEEHYQMLKLLSAVNPEINIAYDTNLTVLGLGNHSVFDYWPKLKRLYISMSCDGHGERGEYIRKGFSWQQFLSNWQEVRAKVPKARMSLSFTLGIYNSFLLTEFLEEVIQLKLLEKIEYFNFEHIEVPEWQSLQVMPLKMKKIVAQRYRDFLKKYPEPYLIKKLEDTISYMMAEDHSDFIPKFRNFTTQIDLLRGESFHKLFEQESFLLGPWPQKT